MAIQPLTFKPQNSQPVSGGSVGGIHPLTGPLSQTTTPSAKPTSTSAPAKVATTPTPAPASPTFVQQVETTGSNLLGQAKGIAENLISQVKGIFTPTGGKPQPIISPIPETPKAPTFTPAQAKTIGTLNVGDIIPDFSTTQAGPSATLKNPPKKAPGSVIETLFKLPDQAIGEAQDFLSKPENAWIDKPLADVQQATETLVKNVPLAGGFIKGANEVYLGSSQKVQDTFKQPVYNPKDIFGKVQGTIGELLGGVAAYYAGGELLKGLGLTKAMLPVLFATLGQTSAGPQTTAIQRLEKAPIDAVAGWLFGEVPIAKDWLSPAALKSAGMGAGILSTNTLVDSLIEGMSPKDSAIAAAKMGVIAGLFHIAGTGVGLFNEKVLGSQFKSGSGEFTPDQARAAVIGTDLEDTPAGKAILKASIDAEAQGKSLKIDMSAAKQSPIAGALNLKTPSGIRIDNITLVEPSAAPGKLPGPEQGITTTTPEGQTPPVSEAEIVPKTAEPAKEVYQTPVVDQSLTKAPQKLTPYDSPEVLKARQQAQAIPETIANRSPERVALDTKIADKLYGKGAPVKEKRLDLVLGPPASGKSTILVNPLAKEHGAIVIDNDEAKKMLPEFQNGIGSAATHKESSFIADGMVLSKAVSAGDNIVLARLGKTQKTMEDLIDLFREHGYKIHLHNIDLPADQVAKRAITRFQETGRFIDPDFIMNNIDGKMTPVYNAIKNREGVISYESYSNDVAKGQTLTLTERSGNENAVRTGGVQQQRSNTNPPGSPTKKEIISKPTTFYRGGGVGSPPPDMSAAEVIKYEQEELGNKDVVAVSGIDLSSIKARNLIWVADSKEAAKDYGQVEKVILSNYRIVARDNMGGLLIDIKPQLASKPEVTTPSTPTKTAIQPITEPSTETAPTKEEQSAIDTVYEALSHDDPDGAHALYEMYTTEDKLRLPAFKEMVDSVTSQQKEELDSITTELQKESTGKPDDPTTVLLGIADKIGKHFSAPGAVFKITGNTREYETPSGTITVGGDMKSAFDNLIFATDLEGFSKNVRVLSDKFDKVFTQIRGIIDHGDIDGGDYEQFKQSIEEALAKRPAYRAGRGAVSKVGAKEGEQKSPSAISPPTRTSKVTPDPETVSRLETSINEGETLLSSNKDTLGKTLTPEKREMIQRATDHSKAKLALITPDELPHSPTLSAPGSPTPFPEATETPMAPENNDRGVGATIPSEAFNGTELRDLLGATIKEKPVKPSQESMLGITGKGSISGAEAMRVFRARQGVPPESAPTPMEEAVAKSEFEKRQADLFAGQAGFIDPGAILDDIKAQMEKAKEGREDASFGTALRMYFVGERDVRIAETNQFVLSAEKLVKKPIEQEALTLMRDFAKRPEDLPMILAGTHPYYDHAVEQFKEENPDATDKEIEKFSEEILKRGAKLKAVVEQAMNPTPGMKTVNAGMTEYFTKRLEEGQKLGFIESKVSPEEYITHMLIPKEEAEKPEGPRGMYAKKNKIGRYFQYAKGRAYKDVVEAYLNGVDPRTLNALDAMSIYGDKHATVAATKLLIQQLKDTELGKFGTRQAEYIPSDWKEIAPESSLFRNEVPFVTTAQMEGLSEAEKAQWEKLVKSGRAKIVGDTYVKADVAHQGLYAPKKVVDALKPITDADYMNLVPGFRQSRLYQAYIKSAELSLSVFHMRALTLTELNNDGVGGIFRQAFKNMNDPKFLEQERIGVRAGLTTSILGRTIEAYNAARNTTVRVRIPTRGELLRMTPGLKQMSGIAQALTHETFGVLQRRMKVTDFATFDAAWIARHPNATPAEHYAAQGQMAKEINAAYGGLQWEILGVNKMTQAVLKFFMLAPDWTYSNLLSVKYVFEGGPAGQHARSFWVRSIIYGIIINQLWSLLMSGHLSDDLTKAYLGLDRFGKKVYSNVGFAGGGSDVVNLIKNINDYGVIQGFAQSAAAKEAPLVRTATEFLTNRNYLGQAIIPKGSGPIVGTARSAYELATGLSPIPFTITDYFNMLTDPKKQFIPAEYATILLGGARATHIVPAGLRQVPSGKRKGQLVPATAPGKARPFWEQVTTGKLTQPKKK